MSQDYIRKERSANQRTSTIAALVISRRHLSDLSQIRFPFVSEYQPQIHVPPIGPEAQLPFILTSTEDDETNDHEEETTPDKTTKRILFFIEPVIGGLILFPIIALFWYCGWNLGLIFSNYLNNFPLNFNINDTIPINYGSYSWPSLVYPYLFVQLALLFYYLCQNLIYHFLEKRFWIIKIVLLQIHIFILATLYIVQWKFLWSAWSQSTPRGWQFEITFSIASLLSTTVVNGHLSSLVCSPFLLSYDSIEYCIHFGCSLFTREVG
jgi:hypothetical protein